MDAYLAGAVLPDTPFYLRTNARSTVEKNLLARAQALHDTAANSFEPVAAAVQAHPFRDPETDSAFSMGLAAHILADAIFHPLVCYFCGRASSGGEEIIRHHLLEAYWDCYFSALDPPLWNCSVAGFWRLLPAGALADGTAAFFSVEGERGAVEKALSKHAQIQGLFRHSALRYILRSLGWVPGFPGELLASSFYPFRRGTARRLVDRTLTYRHPVTGEELSHSPADLAGLVVREGVRLFKSLTSRPHNSSPADFWLQANGPNLLTGLPGIREVEMRHFSTVRSWTQWIF
jgi:hypothetical protein